MTTSLLAKARANRLTALESLRTAKAMATSDNIFSLADARQRRRNVQVTTGTFVSRRAANVSEQPSRLAIAA